MGLLPAAQNWGLRMRRECRERFPRHRLQRKPLVSDPDMHHGTCAMKVLWCMSGSLTRGSGEIVPSILGACATRNFAYLSRGPCLINFQYNQIITQYASDLRFIDSSPLNKMAAILADNNPLPEVMLTQFTDAYMRH